MSEYLSEQIIKVIADENIALKVQVKGLKTEVARLREDYHELIFQVENKYPNETRHETAKRLIREAQRGSNDPHEALGGGEQCEP